MSTLLKLTVAALLIVVGASALEASTASVVTPNTLASFEVEVVTADTMKPAACAGIALTAVVSGSGVITGTAANELVTGSAAVDTIDGLGGDDCILAGAADDSVTGGAGTDVCIGNAGTDTFATCETEIQ